jgi:hypothetical protein
MGRSVRIPVLPRTERKRGVLPLADARGVEIFVEELLKLVVRPPAQTSHQRWWSGSTSAKRTILPLSP